ncbi:uncharacterized protein DS421_10g309360 [Arachis hypogaea]|nr:uncharacterized protein DS421_10g309360 [Arachis hypogaea]
MSLIFHRLIVFFFIITIAISPLPAPTHISTATDKGPFDGAATKGDHNLLLPSIILLTLRVSIPTLVLKSFPIFSTVVCRARFLSHALLTRVPHSDGRIGIVAAILVAADAV